MTQWPGRFQFFQETDEKKQKSFFFLVLTIFDLFWFLTTPLALIHQWIVIVIVIVPWGKFPLSPSLVRSLFWCFPWPKIPKQTIFHRYKHTASVTSLLFEPSSGVSHNKGMCGEVVRDTSRYVKYGVTCAAFIPHTHKWSVCVCVCDTLQKNQPAVYVTPTCLSLPPTVPSILDNSQKKTQVISFSLVCWSEDRFERTCQETPSPDFN